ncbi:DUF481 domain-containing protein [Siphonobacter sp.]|uniref:DUF481 domain-containing protein n=1 Tax=Siphonobacter sp. TaxID=1869184 RepID=UPI003B3B93E4
MLFISGLKYAAVFLLTFAVAPLAHAFMVSDSLRLREEVQTDTLPPGVENFPSLIQVTRPPADTLKHFTYAITLGGDYRSGNVQRSLYTLVTSFDYFNPKSILGLYTSPRYTYGTINKELQERELFVDLNATLWYNQHDVYLMGFGVHEESNLRQISNRWYGGAGFGWRILGGRKVPNTLVKISMTNAIIFEYTDFLNAEDVRVIRNSTRIRVGLTKDKLAFNSTVFVQPALNTANLRWSSLSTLAYALGKRLALSLTADHTYESVVLPGKKRTDFHWAIGLTFKN